MQRFLISIKAAQDIHGVGHFILGKHDQEGKTPHGFTANIFIPGGESGRQIIDASKYSATKSCNFDYGFSFSLLKLP